MNDESIATQIVYVAGYGRSGSTVLDVILGSHPAFMSGGELTYLLDDWDDPARACACGQRYPECPLWSQLAQTLPVPVSQAAALVRRFDRRGALHPRWLADDRRHEAAAAQYATIARGLVELAQRQGARYLVDSSKTAGDAACRPLALSATGGVPVKVLHLVRSPWATWRSVRRSSNWQLEGHGGAKRAPLARAVLGYLLAHGYAYHARRKLGTARYFRMRYEDLLEDPQAVFASLGRYLGIDLGSLGRAVIAGERFKVGHNVGGNRVRLQRAVALQRPSGAPPAERPG